MGDYLLTGAGFSRNWGGWVAAEVFEYLLGCPDLADNVRKQLWNDRAQNQGFEDTLSALQRQAASRNRIFLQQLGQLQGAIRQMFEIMNQALESAAFSPTNLADISVSRFLTRFDAIFTLNQDWLLESHYLNDNVSLESVSGRWSGFVLPGIRLRRDQFRERGSNPILVPSDDSFDKEIVDNCQPYFKLHGSSRWATAEGRDLLIMGANKEDAIHGLPILRWYFDNFKQAISRPDSRLMIIGYGFQDEHINRAIQRAVETSDLKLFIVDPLGVDVVSRYDPKQLVQPRMGLAKALQPAILGASRRPLTSTFSNDFAEHRKLLRFLTR